MRKTPTKISFFMLLPVFFTVVILPKIALCADPLQPRYILADAQRTATLNGGCEGKKQDDDCEINSWRGKCEPKTAQTGGTPELTCQIKECNNETLLWIHTNGTDMGTCHTLQQAKDVCKQQENQCPNGELRPNTFANPNKGYSGYAYQGCTCQPNCAKVYANNPEAIACCEWGDIITTWNGSSCTCNAKGFKWSWVSDDENKVYKGFCYKEIEVKEKPQCFNSDEYFDALKNKCLPQPSEFTPHEITLANEEIEEEEVPECKPPRTWNSNGRCECPSDTPEYKDGKCIVPTKCPDGSTGTYPNCSCNAPKNNYDGTHNRCECPNDKPFFSDGKCIAEKQCPNNASGQIPNCICTDNNKDYNVEKNECIENKLAEKQSAYDAAKEKEQSWANRTLTATTTAATGLGLMQAAQGRAEQKADAAAAADMAGYIQTMRCTYGDGKSVKASQNPIELPGGNDKAMQNLRDEYFALADKLKERKESLGMAPGIESEVILDKANMGLYDQENTGITSGQQSSLYRVQMLNSTADQDKINADKERSEKGVKYGLIAAGTGVGVGLIGNSLINGKLGEAIKNNKVGKETKALLKTESKALENLKECLKTAGVKNTDDLSFENFYPSIMSVKSIDCKRDLNTVKDKDASDLFADSTDAETIYDTMDLHFTTPTLKKMFGATKDDRTIIINKIQSLIKTKQNDYTKARDKDKKDAEKQGFDFGEISSDVMNAGLKDMSSMFSGYTETYGDFASFLSNIAH